ncbi:uncharacterized protein AMSG_06513 [Thecamonas trahens ATCC 50062]|uniref:Protein transport protein Sec61 subunit beta n=1 Tax=Thecamonas trahens ATCC 50062 TaxID=461836 RepID=A0A0L0DFR1_THETB|nr:hypothetical protein AMSG_06513 [Thecamonas trahens ATCC 50062]KNC51162.1 hypothetical protein AMSG_06513 [Thecamonas trahens ATCC 50062]|eukprot:XP_013756364.1 hypothetical protein AMSG_06513 [Thecamonas trahens ATCC 50062]
MVFVKVYKVVMVLLGRSPVPVAASVRRDGGSTGYSFSRPGDDSNGFKVTPAFVVMGCAIFVASVLIMHFVGRVARG